MPGSDAHDAVHSPDGERREFTIDELAAETGVPSRTIRFYQSKKALPAPERRGRKAIYGEAHVARLQLIARLQDQGLTIKAIRGLLTRADRGELDLGDWLGLKTQLQTPWADDPARLVDRATLHELAGADRDGLVADLVRLHLVERTGDRFTVPSPALLDVIMRLERAGIDLEVSAGAARLLRRHLSRAATEVSRHVLAHLADAPDAEALVRAFETLRPVGLEAVQLIFAHEMQKALQQELASGKAADVVRRPS